MKRISLLIAMCAVATSAFAVQIIHGPYLQNVSENGVTIVWVTDTDSEAWVEVKTLNEQTPRHFFESKLGLKSVGRVHKVRITGLEQGSLYNYSIHSKMRGKVATQHRNAKGKPLSFRTLDSSKEQISFLFVTDIHADTLRLERLISKEATQHDFAIFNGDMVSRMRSEKQIFEGFVDKSVELFASNTPFFITRGNHETRGEFSSQFMDYFPTPTNQPYYAIRHGNAIFIMLDCGEDKPDSDIEYYNTADFNSHRLAQVKWLQQLVESEEFKSAKSRVVCIHMPPVRQPRGHKDGLWYGELQLQKLILPALNGQKIDIMLCGHTHTYSYQEPTALHDFPILICGNTQSLIGTINNNAFDLVVRDLNGNPFKEFHFAK